MEELNIRRVEYFYTTIKDQPCGACHLLCRLKEKGVNLCAFHAIPFGADSGAPAVVQEERHFTEEDVVGCQLRQDSLLGDDLEPA